MDRTGHTSIGQHPMPIPPGLVMQGYGAMSLTEFASPVIAPNAEATLRHVLENGVTVINTAGVLSLLRCMIVASVRSTNGSTRNIEFQHCLRLLCACAAFYGQGKNEEVIGGVHSHCLQSCLLLPS